MKAAKGLIVFFISLLILMPKAEAKDFKSWVKNTMSDRPVNVWEDPNGWIYSVGSATYHHTDTDEFLAAQKEATELAIAYLQSFLKTNQIKGFQIIDFDYSKDRYYVLAAAPKSLNPAQTSMTEPAETFDPNTPASNTSYQPEAEHETTGMETALQANGIEDLEYIPADWWTRYEINGFDRNTFTYQGLLYSIGMGKMKHQQNNAQELNLAKKAGIIDAQRNMAAVVGNVYQQINSPGNYQTKINGVVQSAEIVASQRLGDLVMVLIRAPIKNF